jgi:hypothetical protein
MALLAGAWTAVAAFVSFGTIAFNGSARVGVLPVDARHVALAVIAGVLVAFVGWRADDPRRVAVAAAPLLLAFLPWLPVAVPSVFLIWTGALVSLIWMAVGIALLAIARRNFSFHGPASPVLPGVLAAGVFALAAWGASPSLPGGDEPHYLVITQSLLKDGDLKIENNHQRGDYRAYFAGDLAPHSLRRGRNGEIYSIHAPGVPALVLPAFAIGGYHGVVVFLILLSAAACALAWWLAWRITGSAAAAWFGWAVVTGAAPFLLESYTVFPDGPGAIVVLTGFWALLRAEREQMPLRRGDPEPAGDSGWGVWVLHGMALALLPWMHTRFAVLAGTLGGLVLVRMARVRNQLGKAVAFLAVPALSALAWLFFFTIIYGTPDPSAPYGPDTQNSLAYLPDGFGGLLFDQGFGLLATAPVLVFGLVGFWRVRRLAVDWLVVALPYLLAVATYAMWWAGSSGPARFLVPLILPLAIPAACAWAAASRGVRAVMLAALVISAWLSFVMAGAGGGFLGYHTRNEGGATAAPWLEWANHAVDLPAAFPSFVPEPVQPDPRGLVSRSHAARAGFAATVPWLLCLGAAAALIIAAARRRPAAGPETLVSVTTFAFGSAAMLAVAIVWLMDRREPLTATTAQMDVLRELAGGGVAAVSLAPPHRLSIDDAWNMPMDVTVRRGRGGRPNAPLVAFPAVPAGSYQLSVRRHGGGDGLVMVGVGNDQFNIVMQPIAAYDAGVRIDLPVAVRALLVRTDEGARAQLESVELRPLTRAPARLTPDTARRAVRYGDAVAFFLDDRAFPEPSGFWVRGARDTKVVFQSDGSHALSLLVRNGPAANTVTIESGAWKDELPMAPGEERRIDVPADSQRGTAHLVRIASSAGFRPSEVNAGSRDTRLLGVFVRTSER